MRGDEVLQEELFSYGSLIQRVPLAHPLRRVRGLADEAMQVLEPRFRMDGTLITLAVAAYNLVRIASLTAAN